MTPASKLTTGISVDHAKYSVRWLFLNSSTGRKAQPTSTDPFPKVHVSVGPLPRRRSGNICYFEVAFDRICPFSGLSGIGCQGGISPICNSYKRWVFCIGNSQGYSIAHQAYPHPLCGHIPYSRSPKYFGIRLDNKLTVKFDQKNGWFLYVNPLDNINCTWK